RTIAKLFWRICERALLRGSFCQRGIVLRQLDVVSLVPFRIAVKKIAFAQSQGLIPGTEPFEFASIHAATFLHTGSQLDFRLLLRRAFRYLCSIAGSFTGRWMRSPDFKAVIRERASTAWSQQQIKK